MQTVASEYYLPLYQKLTNDYRFALDHTVLARLEDAIEKAYTDIEFDHNEVYDFFIASKSHFYFTIKMFKEIGLEVLTFDNLNMIYFGNACFYYRHHDKLFDLVTKAYDCFISDEEVIRIFKKSFRSHDKFFEAMQNLEKRIIEEETIIDFKSSLNAEVATFSQLLQKHTNISESKWLSFSEACRYANRGKNWMLDKLKSGDIYGYQELGVKDISGKWVIDKHSIDSFYLQNAEAIKLKLNDIFKEEK